MKYLTFKKTFFILGIGAVFFSCKPDLGDFTDGFNKDNGLSPNVEVDTSNALTNTSKYPQARSFPGLVCDNNRVDTTINLPLNYTQRTNDELRISVAPTPLFSTGLYAAAGDLVTIEVPQGEYSLSVQIGAWTDDLTGKEASGPLLRDPRITTSKALAPGMNTVRNLYGGHIYIKPAKPVASPVTLKFKRVCVSPDFVLGTTTNAEWQQKIRNSCVPWLELRSKHIVYVVSREFCLNKPINDPQALMSEWDVAIREDCFSWTGLTGGAADPMDESPALPYRVVFDVQPSIGYGHSGFPIVVTNDYHWFGFSTDLSWLKGSNVWGIYHEIGHNMQMNLWSWSTLGETSNNLFNFKLARRNELAGYPNAWPAKQDCWTCTHAQIFANAINNFVSKPAKNFDATNDTTINDPFRRMTPFLQIFDYIKPNMPGVNRTSNNGWDFMAYLYAQGRRELRPPTSDILKHDFVYTNLCEFTQMDWFPFFKSWGIELSNIAIAKMGAKYSFITKNLWTYNPATRTGGTGTVGPKVVWTPTASSWATNEAAPNGVIANAFDGLYTTYWHSNYGTGTGPTTPPFTITVDMARSAEVKGFRVGLRQSGTGVTTVVRTIYVETSTNGTTWTPVVFAGTGNNVFTTTNIQGPQDALLQSNITCRYFRLTIPAGNSNGTSAALSEIDILNP